MENKKALYLASQIGKRKTVDGKRKAILRWCAEVKRLLS
jgi:hypothetical protein